MASGRALLQTLGPAEDRGIDTCTTCPTLCRWACPVAEAEARETTSPNRLVVLSGLVKKERVPVASQAAFPYHCSHCLACTAACLHRNDVPLLLSMARSRALSAGVAPGAVSEVCGHFGVAGNAQGTSLEGALDAVVNAAGTQLSRSGDTVYLPGCTTLEQGPEVASAFLRALSLLGLPRVSVRPQSAACCGAPLFWAGELEGFRAHATRFVTQFTGVRRLVVHDPACAHTLRQRYRDVGVEVPFQVQHVASFLAEHLEGADRRGPQAGDAGRQARGESGTIAYTDSCSLARGLGVIDEPRRLLARCSGAPPVELAGLRGAQVDCCGAGGLLPLTVPGTARTMAEERIAAFRASGATQLATFSPRCAAHLKATDPTLPVVDVATLLARLS